MGGKRILKREDEIAHIPAGSMDHHQIGPRSCHIGLNVFSIDLNRLANWGMACRDPRLAYLGNHIGAQYGEGEDKYKEFKRQFQSNHREWFGKSD